MYLSRVMNKKLVKTHTQSVFNWSKLTIETLEQNARHVQS